MVKQPPLEDLQREVERIFHDLVYHRHPVTHFGEPAWSPSADLVVSQDQARVLIELAGVPRESVRVTLRGRTLEISGRRMPPADRTDALYHRAEIFFGDFRRTIELPWESEEGGVEARFRDGMLEVRLQRAPAHQTSEISVERQTT
jgi:HSP20 family protein